MAILTREQLLANIRNLIGEDTSDNALKLIEDVSDTVNDYENKAKDKTDWEKRYKENDEEWRKRYKERFFNAPVKEDDSKTPSDDEDDDNKNKNLTYDNLFKEETK